MCTEISAHKGHMEGHYELVTPTSGIDTITRDKAEIFNFFFVFKESN